MARKSISQTLRDTLSFVPVLGPLAYCRVTDHTGALREFVVVLGFATATFWLTAVFMLGWDSGRALGYWALLKSTIHSGELFIFSLGFLGPILINAGDDPKMHRAFPGRMSHLFALVILGIIASGFHSQIRFAFLSGKPSDANLEFWFEASLWIAAFAVVLRYLSMVYKKQSFDPERDLKNTEQDFAKGYQQHRQQGGQQ